MKTTLKKDDLHLRTLFHSVEPDLDRIQHRISQLSQNLDPGITGYVDYATEHSGKHLRAALVMFAGKATGELQDEHDDLAVVVELIHLASLIHDDVLDHADIRRSLPTANAKWGAEISVLLGDCLFAYALKLCTRFENHDILCSVADASNEVCTGEILQTQRRFDLKLSIPEYLEIIRKKTGALFRVSTEMAGVINNVRPEIREALRRYGENLGTAYQIYDDCLDLLGSERKTGKTLGTDLARGKLTLPVLHMLQQLHGTEANTVHEKLLQGDESDLEELHHRISQAGGYAYSVRSARKLLDAGTQSVLLLKGSPDRDRLIAIAEMLEKRLASL